MFAAVGMYNALMEHKKTGGKITTKVDSKAMSAATIPLMAGDERLMSPPSLFMMHNPLMVVYGYASEHRKAADVLDEIKEAIMNAYQIATGRSRAKISAMMDDETYMNARNAVKEGFATGMLYADGNNGVGDPVEGITNFSRLSVINAANISKTEFLKLAQSNQLQPDAGGHPVPEPGTKQNNEGGNNRMEIKTVEDLQKAYPELCNQLITEAKDTAAADERKRIQAIDEIAPTVAQDLVVKAKYEEPITAEALAFQALKADAGKGQDYLNARNEEAAKANAAQVTSAPNNPDAGDEEADLANKVAASANKKRDKEGKK